MVQKVSGQMLADDALDDASTDFTPGNYLRVGADSSLEQRSPSQVLADIGAAAVLDADLTAIAAVATTGVLVRTGTNTWNTRAIAAQDVVLTVTDGNGVAGAPTLALTPPDYIEGLKLTWNSGTSLGISMGAAYIQSLGRVIRAGSNITKASLSLANNTWYHLYLYLNAGTPDVEVVTTAPVVYSGTARSKTGDTSRRYIGSVKTEGTANVIKFAHDGLNNIKYLNNVSVNLVLNSSLTSAVTLTVTDYAPVTASFVGVHFLNQTASANNANLGYQNGPVPASGSWIAFTPSLAANQLMVPMPAVGDNLQARYDSASASGSLAWVNGYQFER